MYDFIDNIYKSLKINISDSKYNPYENITFYYNKCITVSGGGLTLVEADIKSAFPTFVKLFFSQKYPDLVVKIESEKDKIKRNIMISTTLNTDELKLLNYLSKAYIIKFMFTNFQVIDMVELKKDGGVFLIVDEDIDNIYENDGIVYKMQKIKKYVRFSNTSLYYYSGDDDLVIKGKYKNVPPSILDFYKNKTNVKELLKKYDDVYFYSIIITEDQELINDAYVCSNNTILRNNKKYMKYEKPSDLLLSSTNIYKNTFIIPFVEIHNNKILDYFRF